MKHLRPLNLLMFALTQGVCCWYLFWGKPDIPFLSLALLLFSINTIMAGGYLINDYYDRAIDARNKPHKALPDTREAKRKALLLYAILNGLGVLTAVPPALAPGKPLLVFIQVGMVLAFWAYSRWWKGMPVIGNVAVAALIALSLLMIYWYHPQLKVYEGDTVMLLLFAGFAFVLTWMREMVKDIEDMEGDRAEGCRTLPIVWGVKPVVILTSVLSFITVLPLAMGSLLALGDTTYPLGIALLLVVVSLLVWTVFLFHAKTSKDFGRLSNILKLIMLGGLLCLMLI